MESFKCLRNIPPEKSGREQGWRKFNHLHFIFEHPHEHPEMGHHLNRDQNNENNDYGSMKKFSTSFLYLRLLQYGHFISLLTIYLSLQFQLNCSKKKHYDKTDRRDSNSIAVFIICICLIKSI